MTAPLDKTRSRFQQLSSPIEPGFCQCGCGERTNVRDGQPRKFLPDHNLRPRPHYWTIEDRGHDTPCWIWQGSLDTRGYGRFVAEGVKYKAFWFYWEQENGPVPEGLVLDHLCRVPACMNPAHLEPVTNGENVLRGQGPPALNARKAECQNGHPFDAENTYTDPTGRRRCRTCDRDYMREYMRAYLPAYRARKKAS